MNSTVSDDQLRQEINSAVALSMRGEDLCELGQLMNLAVASFLAGEPSPAAAGGVPRGRHQSWAAARAADAADAEARAVAARAFGGLAMRDLDAHAW